MSENSNNNNTWNKDSGNTTAALTYTAAEVGQMLGIGRTYTYEYLKKVYKEKEPFTVQKFGSIYKIPKYSFDAWLLSL